MKLLKTSVVALSLIASSVASFAQTAEEIVSKHIAAIGGEEKLKTIKTIKMDGSLSMQGMEIPVVITALNNKAWRLDMNIMGTANYQILTDKEGWMYFPIQQQQKPEPMTADAVKAMHDQLDLQGELVDYKAKGNKIELLGKDDMEGTEVYKIKVTNKEGKETTMYFDAANYYLLREVEKIQADGKEEEMATNYSNFQKLPEGFVFPMTIESPQGPIIFKTVEVNGKVDENIFKPSN